MSHQPFEPTQSLLAALATQLQTLQIGEIAAASVKLPEFWATSPEIWFARIEAQFTLKTLRKIPLSMIMWSVPSTSKQPRRYTMF